MGQSLLFQVSPICPLAAEVVQNETCIYFYLYDLNFDEEKLVTRSACWVKNLQPASAEFDYDAMEEGRAPAIPSEFVLDLDDIAPLKQEDLSIVWSKEGHIAALYEKEKILAIIPSWAVPGEMSGYSRNTKSNHMSGWPLTDDNALIARMEEGKRFWDQDFQEVWMNYSTKWLNELEQKFGEAKQCLRLTSEEEFPALFLMVYEHEGISYAFSAGAGIFSMPNTDQYMENYEARARTEFAFSWKSDALSDVQQHQIFSQLSAIVQLPWQSVDYIGHGHTLDFPLESFPYAICVREEATDYKTETEDVNLHWIIPISEHEFTVMCEAQSNQALISELRTKQRQTFDVRRKERGV